MKPRTGIAALALAVAAPLVTAVPAAAAGADPIDPIARASLQAVLTASPAAVEEQGGRVVERWSEPDGSTMVRFVNDSDNAGHSRLRVGGSAIDLRTDLYFADRRIVASYVPRVIRSALARHGLAHPASWYVPRDASSEVGFGIAIAGGAEFSMDPVGDLSHHLVGLSATTEGPTTTYTATVRLSRRATETIIVEASGGLVDSISAKRASLFYRYGHAPMTVPAATREHASVIAAELRLATLARDGAQLLRMLRGVGKAARVTTLKQLLTQQIRVVDKRIRLREVPGGVELTRPVAGFRLTWRVRVDGRKATARPVRTA